MPTLLNKLATSSPAAASLSLLLLRLTAGGFMALGHGWPKVQKFSSDPSSFPDPLGIGGTMSFVGAVGSELVCGLLVAMGLFTRVACLPLIFTMLVAATVVHGKDPFFMGGGAAKEPALVYLMMFMCILLAGPGKWSLDAKLFGGTKTV
jgi:putative oxidoreductase